MAVHTCPDEICAAFSGDEPAKQKARLDAIKWLNGRTLKVGDSILLPHPKSGKLIEFVKDRRGMEPATVQ